MPYLLRVRVLQWGLKMNQWREQVQYLLETNDEVKINIVLDVLSHLDHRELMLVKDLINMRIKLLLEEKIKVMIQEQKDN